MFFVFEWLEFFVLWLPNYWDLRNLSALQQSSKFHRSTKNNTKQFTLFNYSIECFIKDSGKNNPKSEKIITARIFGALECLEFNIYKTK